MHININSLPPKIDELRYIASLSTAAATDISESKLKDSVLYPEIQIENYDLIRSERNSDCGDVAYFIRNNSSYKHEIIPFSWDRKYIHRNFFLPYLKPLIVGSTYHPPYQCSLIKTYILGVFNNELFLNQYIYIYIYNKYIYIINKYIYISSNEYSMSHEVKNYFQFCCL